MSLIWNVLVGLVAGVLAKMIMKTGPSGWIWTAALGIAGSMVGGILFGLLGFGGGPSGIIGSVVGAILLLWLYGKFMANK